MLYSSIIDKPQVRNERGKTMNKHERIKQMITDNIVIEAISPWDGIARFDQYEVIVHKYDNEDLSLIEDDDPRIAGAAERIFQLIDPKEWDQLIAYHSVGHKIQSNGERKPIPRGRRNG